MHNDVLCMYVRVCEDIIVHDDASMYMDLYGVYAALRTQIQRTRPYDKKAVMGAVEYFKYAAVVISEQPFPHWWAGGHGVTSLWELAACGWEG